MWTSSRGNEELLRSSKHGRDKMRCVLERVLCWQHGRGTSRVESGGRGPASDAGEKGSSVSSSCYCRLAESEMMLFLRRWVLLGSRRGWGVELGDKGWSVAWCLTSCRVEASASSSSMESSSLMWEGKELLVASEGSVWPGIWRHSSASAQMSLSQVWELNSLPVKALTNQGMANLLCWEFNFLWKSTTVIIKPWAKLQFFLPSSCRRKSVYQMARRPSGFCISPQIGDESPSAFHCLFPMHRKPPATII